ncbi:unnamed protein product [Mycena citricolor]|uniref:Fungal pheromone STE3G-protein-coupled receptor n=1 Tax=Mycena citricolor TaxID=2018698 RepID=A0AAD2HHL0_9AGAR|nr:unnamed protein product [Mycena citricolor]
MPSALVAAPVAAGVLVLATLPHHWRVGNIATRSIIAWLLAYNLIYAVNSTVWAGNVEIVVPVWCDISTKVKIGADMGLPGCVLCLARRLNRIARGLPSAGTDWPHRLLDFMLCMGFPVVIMALHVIVQGHRFDIVENIGCLPAIYISLPSVIILDVSAFIPASLALVYCSSASVRLWRRRLAFRKVVEICDDGLADSMTAPRYIRLMVMTFCLGTWNAVLVSISAANEYSGGLQPWVSWAFVHDDFGNIGLFPAAKFSPGAKHYLYILWWAVPMSSLCFFVFFGLGADAMQDYRGVVAWLLRGTRRGRRPGPQPITSTLDLLKSTSTCASDSQAQCANLYKDLPPLPYDV